MLNVNALQRFFLEAVRKTYAADAPPFKIAELPGYECIRYERDGYLYVDSWYASDRINYGQTTISFRGERQWCMQYDGEWDGEDPELIPFLKQALLVETGFNGGRGPDYYHEGNFHYYNDVKISRFVRFRGIEKIRVGLTQTLAFWHDYHGGVMVPLSELR